MSSTYRIDLDALTIIRTDASGEDHEFNCDDFEQAAIEADEHGDSSGTAFYRAAAKGDHDALERVVEMLNDAADAADSDVADDDDE